MRQVKCINLGLIDYKQAWDYQEKLFAEIVSIKIGNRNLSPENVIQTPNYI